MRVRRGRLRAGADGQSRGGGNGAGGTGGGRLRHGRARGRGRRALSAGAGLAVGLSLVGVVAAGEGTPPARMDLRVGGAWVASSRVGLLTLIDGETAEVVARIDVGDASQGLVSAQAGPVGFAVDGERGTVVRVDPRTFEADRAVVAIERPSGRVSARATDTSLYLVDDERGRVVTTDPDEPGPEQRGSVESLAEAVGSSVVDDEGRLWVLGASSGDLVWFEGGVRRDREGVTGAPRGAELVAVDGGPVLVDRAARSVRRIGADGGLGDETCVDIGADDDSVRFGGSRDTARVYAVSGRQGVLRVSDLGSGSCSSVAIPVSDPGDELGVPVEAAGRVFVPNFATGRVAVVDVGDEQAVETDPVAEGAFELFDEDGIVFYNDRDSERAGVIHLDGTVAATQKYDPADPDAGVDNREPEDRTEVAAPEPSPTPPPGDEPEPVPVPPATSGPQPGVSAPPPAPGPGPRAGDTRPARPDELPTLPPAPPTTPTTAPGGTPTTDPGSSTTPSPTPAPTPPPTPPPTPGPTPPPCSGGDPDGDGVPNSCDGDDDNDGIGDAQDGYPTCNDNFDQDGDGIPDACDGTDDSPPNVAITSVTRARRGFYTYIDVTVTADDPDSGISSISFTISGTYQCDSEQARQSLDTGDSRGGVTGVTFSTPLYCDAANDRIGAIDVQVVATALNGDGVPPFEPAWGNFSP